MQHASGGLVQTLLGLPVFRSEWVLYLLLGLSLASVAVMVERWFFYRSHRVDADALRTKLSELLAAGDFGGAAKLLQGHDALETNVVLAGLRAYELGPESAEELIAGALGQGEGALRKAPELPGDAGQQRALRRSVRNRSRHRAFVPRSGGQHGRRQLGGHGRHRRVADRDRGRPAGRDPGGRRLQRLQGAREELGHRRADAGAHADVAAEGGRAGGAPARRSKGRAMATLDDAAEDDGRSRRSTSSRSSTSCWCCWSSSC